MVSSENWASVPTIATLPPFCSDIAILSFKVLKSRHEDDYSERPIHPTNFSLVHGFQVGLEDRSVMYYHKMAELARNGALGKLQAIHAKLAPGTALPIEQPVPPPPELNWDLWLGPAPFRPYTPTITQSMHWRQIRGFSGGLLTDWGSHLLDTAQVAVSAEQSGPVEVEGVGELPKNSMPGGYSPNQIASQIMAQCGDLINQENKEHRLGNRRRHSSM